MNLKNIFKIFNTTKITQYVIFDGDQTPSKVIQKMYVPNKNIKYDWVGVVSVPKVVRDIINTIQPTNYGKEASDNQIAISITDNLHKNKDITSVSIISNDGDFVDVILSLVKLFPTVNFYLVSFQDTRTQGKKKYLNNLHKNCFSARIVV